MTKKFISIILIIIGIISHNQALSQTCPTATGDQVTFGTNNVWIGYVYNNLNFTDYMGFVNEGVPTNPNFDQSFGGGNVNYPTSTCPTNTNTFSVRYKLQKTLTAGTYTFLIGGDDGVRLSIDGGLTYILNDFSDHGYREIQTTLALTAGIYDIILEYYENGGGNRVRFDFTPDCIPVTLDQTSYGTGDVWRGIAYNNQNFTSFKGILNAGTTGNPNFDINFGGDFATFATSDCPVYAETFSIRFKLNKNFPAGLYNITIGGDDGYRLSIDGGVTFPYANFADHAYTTTTFNVSLNGSTDLVYEYYENGTNNRVSFQINTFSPLPIELLNFHVEAQDTKIQFNWSTASEKNNAFFEILESNNALDFTPLAKINSKANNGNSNSKIDYNFQTNVSNSRYYKLKQTDFDGKFSESEIAYIENSETVKVLITPNPFSDIITIDNKNSRMNPSFEIYDLNGHLVDAFKSNPNQNSWQYQLLAPKGIYILKTIANNKIQIQRLVKL